jgi:dolichyl-phosphate-mannose--protein O-mannosyl transferase
LWLAWYPSFAAVKQGLEKNVLAGLDYRVGVLCLLLALMVGVGWLPWVLLGMGDALTRGLALAAVVTAMLSFGLCLRTTGQPWPLMVLEPVVLGLFVFVCARAAALTLWRGGIVWRGTFYPLAELRRWRG